MYRHVIRFPRIAKFAMRQLQYVGISGWLDDIGLPQYKGVFYENRVDGRILQNMTLVSLSYLSFSYLFLLQVIQAKQKKLWQNR